MSNFTACIQVIKDHISLKKEVSAYVKLSMRGTSLIGLCPFHTEKTPSFHVFENRKTYHCFGCGAHGDVISFLIAIQRKTLHEVCTELSHKTGIPLPNPTLSDTNSNAFKVLYDIHEKAAHFYKTHLLKDSSALEYVRSRGLSDHTIDAYCIGYAPAYGLLAYLQKLEFSKKHIVESGIVIEALDGTIKDRFKKRLQFPIFNVRRKIIGFGGRMLERGEPKYLNSPTTSIFHKKSVLYGVHVQRHLGHGSDHPSHFLDNPIVVEGYFDVLTLHQAGITSAVAPLGTAISIEHLSVLWASHACPIFCLDGDEAGIKAALRVAYMVLSHLSPSQTAEFVLLPKGEDPDSLCLRLGREAFLDFIKTHKKSIFDIIFEDCLRENWSEQSPEIREGRIQTCIKRFESIPDSFLRSEFQLEVRKRVNALHKHPISHTFERTKFQKTPAFNGGHPKIPPVVLNKKEVIEKILLVSLLINPHILDQLEDTFMAIQFQNDYFDTIRQLILKVYSEKEESITFSDLSERMDLESVSALMTDQTLINYAPFLTKKGVEFDIGLTEMLNEYTYKDTLIHEQTHSIAFFKEQSGQLEWDRIKTLKKSNS